MNSEYVIQGGRPLCGTLQMQGAKNSVLPILAASILGQEQAVIQNCPVLTDVEYTAQILRHLGCEVKWENRTVEVDPRSMSGCCIPDEMMRELRASINFMGAILARTGEAHVSRPGGCDLGQRSIDLHIDGLRALGAEIVIEDGILHCKASRLLGADIHLTKPSVGATENIMLAATAAKGVTRINNAAMEPEIKDLQVFLRAMGAEVSGAGTSTVVIEGGKTLHGAVHRVIPDRIVSATYLMAAAMAGGEITLEAVCPAHLSTVTSALAEAGCDIRAGSDTITLARAKPLKAVRLIQTMPYPGFPTDAQSQLMAVTTKAEGTTVFVETIFDSRFQHVNELARMGADIVVADRTAVVRGVPRLYGARVQAKDLRAGAALTVAALGAEGESRVTGLKYIDRGYERFEQNLTMLGAEIRRLSTGPAND